MGRRGRRRAALDAPLTPLEIAHVRLILHSGEKVRVYYPSTLTAAIAHARYKRALEYVRNEMRDDGT